MTEQKLATACGNSEVLGFVPENVDLRGSQCFAIAESEDPYAHVLMLAHRDREGATDPIHPSAVDVVVTVTGESNELKVEGFNPSVSCLAVGAVVGLAMDKLPDPDSAAIKLDADSLSPQQIERIRALSRGTLTLVTSANSSQQEKVAHSDPNANHAYNHYYGVVEQRRLSEGVASQRSSQDRSAA